MNELPAHVRVASLADPRRKRRLTSDICRSYLASDVCRLQANMAKETGDRLSRREREIMDAVFALGNRAFAEDIRDRLPQPPSLSAVRVMLARLEAKGDLQHKQIDGRNVYSATTSPTTAQRAALRRYVRTFFGGSLHDMIAALVRDEPWTDEDLRSLRGEIDRARKQRGERKPS